MTRAKPIRKRTRVRPSTDGASSAASMTAGPPTDYEIGYKKPPKHTRFKPGQSGNPRGRPKGARNLRTELTEELGERIRIKEGGAPRTVSKQRAMLKSLVSKAVQGDARAANLLCNLVLKLVDQDDVADQAVDLGEDDLAILENYARRVGRREKNNVG